MNSIIHPYVSIEIEELLTMWLTLSKRIMNPRIHNQ